MTSLTQEIQKYRAQLSAEKDKFAYIDDDQIDKVNRRCAALNRDIRILASKRTRLRRDIREVRESSNE